MKTSFCSIAFAKNNLKIEEIIPEISSIGYDGIEIWGNHLEDFLSRHKNEPSSLREIKKLTQDNNLSIPMISPYFNLTGNKEEWEKSIKEAKRFIEFARILGSPLIRGFTGEVSSKEASEEQRASCIKGYIKICEMAMEKEISIALETHGGNLIDTSSTTLRLIKEVDRKNLKVNLDIYNLFMVGENPLQALDKLWDYTVHFHLKNMKNGKACYLDEGEMDYGPILKELNLRRFNGFLSIEWFGDNPWEAARQEISYLNYV